jgi:general secretion pathway protein C
VADRAHRGYAVIAVDGQSAQPFGVGSLVAQGLVLQSVSARSAVLGASRKGPAAVTLELPLLDKPLDKP